MPVLVWSVKSSILSSASFQINSTFRGVASAAVEQSRRKANMFAHGDEKFGPRGWPQSPPKPKKGLESCRHLFCRDGKWPTLNIWVKLQNFLQKKCVSAYFQPHQMAGRPLSCPNNSMSATFQPYESYVGIFQPWNVCDQLPALSVGKLTVPLFDPTSQYPTYPFTTIEIQIPSHDTCSWLT